MSEIYRVDDEGRTEALSRIRCRDEDRELQTLLSKNLDLLPGSQIRPDDPIRWLRIRREMPVPDPAGGGDRWSIDFFLVDQEGMPTFVECKRFLDTRVRREVVGQMLEYAANGVHYWTREVLRSYAGQSATDTGQELDELVRRLRPTSGETIDDLLDAVENNLREGQVRLVFFLEEAPIELKSIVDFLNRQMERSEVLIVEAKLYEAEGTRFVSPRLFGYTEEARRAKRTITVRSGARRKWTEEDFFEESATKLAEPVVSAMHRLLEFARSKGLKVNWGTGIRTGSFNLVLPSISPRSILTVNTDGNLYLNFGWLDDSPEAIAFRDRFHRLAVERLGVSLPESAASHYPGIKPAEWTAWPEKLEGLIVELLELVER